MSKKYIIIVCIALIVAIALAVAVTLTVGNDEMPEIQSTARPEKLSDSAYCVLVLGEDKVSGLTDVMMLARFDISNRSASVMQIPRDTYADYGSSYKKLNGALKYLGSEEKLCEFLSESLGIEIDGYVSLGLSAFRNAIDAVGGVELELDKAIRYSDPEQKLYIDLPAGKQVLDGKKAEMLVRFRSGYVRGDLDRLDVQKSFLIALFNKLKSSVDISNAYEFATKVLSQMSTNIDIPLAVALGLKAIALDNSDIALLTLPGEAVVSQKSGGSYYVMSVEPTREALSKFFALSGENIDSGKRFKNLNDKSFCEIYDKKFDFSVSFADDKD